MVHGSASSLLQCTMRVRLLRGYAMRHSFELGLDTGPPVCVVAELARLDAAYVAAVD
jgi:hypothetical protein